MSLRRAAYSAAAAIAFALWAPAAAFAVFRGTDVFQNIAPDSAPGLADRYPLSHYGLDFHVAGPSLGIGGASAGDIPGLIAQFLAAQMFAISAFIIRVILGLFEAAFTLDLINGPRGALAPIGQATQHLYGTISVTFLSAAVALAGLWAMHKAMIERRYQHAATGIAMSVACIALAVLIISRPAATVGTVSQMTNQASTSMLAATTNTGGSAQSSIQRVNDHFFETFIYRPWVVLEFGGLSHCVSGERDKDGFPRPVGPRDPAATVCRDHLTQHGGFGGYAPRFLKYAIGTDERDSLYDAMNRGEIPAGSAGDPQFAGWRVDKADAPAVDIQQGGGAFQRFTFALLFLLGVLGVALMLGMLCFVALIAQVVALGLLALAPAALLAGVFPGRGHDAFAWWLGKLALALLVKVAFALLLAILVTVSIALESSTESLGFLFAFGLQAAFFWTVFLKRKVIAGAVMKQRDTTRLESSVTDRTKQVAGAGAAVVGGAVAAPAAAARARQEKIAERKRTEKTTETEKTSTQTQEHARRNGDTPTGPVHAPAPAVAAAANGHRQEDDMPIATPTTNGTVPAQSMEAALAAARENPAAQKPKVSHSAVRLQAQQREEGQDRPPQPPSARVPPLRQDLERARRPPTPVPVPVRAPRERGQEKVREREEDLER